jgi:hypothetical protein
MRFRIVRVRGERSFNMWNGIIVAMQLPIQHSHQVIADRVIGFDI